MLPIITRRRVLSALLGILLLLALPATAGGVRGLGAPVRAHPAPRRSTRLIWAHLATGS